MADKRVKVGTVKQVISGDTVLIQISGSSEVQELTMDYIKAPRLSCHPHAYAKGSPTESEPWAWEAFDHLRRCCIGQRVTFQVERRGPGPDAGSEPRDYGTLWLGVGATKTDIAETMLIQGLLELPWKWATSTRYKDLAKAKDKAVEKITKPYPTYKWTISDIGQYTTTRMADRTVSVQGVIMAMENSTTFWVVLKPDMYYSPVSLTGVKGSCRRAHGLDEKYAEPARSLINQYFLQREVAVVIEGVYNQLLFASLLYSETESGRKDRSMAEFLVRRGAVVVDENDDRYGFGMENLRNAAVAATEEGLRLCRPDKLNPGNRSSLARFSPEDGVGPRHVEAERKPDASLSLAISKARAQLNTGTLDKDDLLGALSEALDREMKLRTGAATTEQGDAQGSKSTWSAEGPAAAKAELARHAKQQTVQKYVAALHARALIEGMDLQCTGTPKRQQATNRWPRWSKLLQDLEAKLQAVMINHEQLIPPPVFTRLLSILKDVYDTCSGDIHSLELLDGRAIIDADYFGDEVGKILMALCICQGIDFTYYRNGEAMDSWREVTADGFPIFGTLETDGQIF